MNSSRISLIPIAIWALVLVCVPTRSEGLQCKIDVVFLLDVSSSMDDEIGALCTKINSVAGLLAAHNVDTRYEIFALYDGRTSCSEKTTRAQFGDQRDGVRSIEDWGRGVSVVAVEHGWQEDVVKLVVPISDEGPSEGNPVDQEDDNAIEQAIGRAQEKGVVVSPIVGTGASKDVIHLAEKIAAATDGKAFRSIQPDEDMFDGIFEQIQQACLSQQVQIPDVIGLSREQAVARLSEAGLALRRVSDEPSSQPPGTIFDQNPPAGTTVKVHTPVDVVLAQGMVVPDVSGLSREEAAAQLREAGLELGRMESEPSARSPGTIVGQNPPGGTMVSPGAKIHVVTAEGVMVPNVSGLSHEEAAARLREAGLELGRVESEPSARSPGTILGQNPPGGTIVPLGTTVSLQAGVIPWVGLTVAIAASLILILLVGFYAHKQLSRRSQRRGRLEFFLGKDLGIQHLEPRVSTPANTDVRVRIVRQRGSHTIEAEAPLEVDE